MKKSVFLLLLFIVSSNLNAQIIRLATYRYDTNARIANLEPLAEELQKKTGKKVELKSYNSIPEFITALQSNQVDIAFINTFGYLLYKTASSEGGMEAVASWVVPPATEDVYKTSIVVKKGSGISWKNLPSKAGSSRMSLVAEGSTSGNLIPRLLLNGQLKKDPDNSFASIHYAGTHHGAVLAVLNGNADLAAMGQDAFYKLMRDTPAYRDQLDEIMVSPEIPLGPVMLNSGLDPFVSAKVRECLLHLHATNPHAMEQIRAGWTEARKATHFEKINPDHYTGLLDKFGNAEEVAEILRKFAR